MQTKALKKKLVLKSNVKRFLSQTLVTIIIFLVGLICIKANPTNKVFIEKNIFETSIKFTKLKNIYQKYFGDVLSLDKLVYEDTPVFNEKIEYKESAAYKDGVALTVADKYLVPSLESGIVVYIGPKENYGETIIVEQTNGIDVFYSNITPSNLKLYDYVEKGECLGETKEDKLYLIFQKNGQNLNYQEYI